MFDTLCAKARALFARTPCARWDVGVTVLCLALAAIGLFAVLIHVTPLRLQFRDTLIKQQLGGYRDWQNSDAAITAYVTSPAAYDQVRNTWLQQNPELDAYLHWWQQTYNARHSAGEYRHNFGPSIVHLANAGMLAEELEDYPPSTR